MYKIGDFSRITKLTVKALRYYDSEGLLVPSHRDSENAYRYYDEADFQKAQIIVMLRDLDFSISELKDVLANCENLDDLSCYLEEKRNHLEIRIAREKALIQKINLHIHPKKREENGMSYVIEIKKVDAVKVASVRYQGKYSDVGKYIGKLYKAVKNKTAGAPFNLYYDAEYKEEADIEVCLPISESVRDSSITMKTLPAVQAICTVHKGSYEKLNLAYKALTDYASQHNLQGLIPTREVYLKGPGMIFKGSEEDYLTEVIIPIKEA